jgi:hypothetical protein
MDCKTARLLLDFARPQARELEAEEAGALESHLDHCPDCHSLAHHERLFDERLGEVMRQVEPPAGLRDQLLARLEAERGDWQRQRFARAARWTAAAAAVLLLSWAGWRWLLDHSPPPIDPAQVASAFNNDSVEEPRQRAERILKQLGVQTTLSPHLNYHLLICPPALTELPGYPGRQVPMLVFARHGHTATVYLLPEKALPPDAARVLGGATYKTELLRFEGEPYCYLVIYDGDNLDWLRPPQPQAA